MPHDTYTRSEHAARLIARLVAALENPPDTIPLPVRVLLPKARVLVVEHLEALDRGDDTLSVDTLAELHGFLTDARVLVEVALRRKTTPLPGEGG